MVQGAAERHQAQITTERRQCEELCKQLNGQLIQERQSASNQLTQVLLQLDWSVSWYLAGLYSCFNKHAMHAAQWSVPPCTG